MTRAANDHPGVVYWLVTALLMLWGLGSVSMYTAYFVETPEAFAQGAENAEHRSAYADYVASLPVWAVAVGVGAALARLLGAIGLLLRRAWALPLFIAALILFLVASFRAFILADVASVMSGAHIAVEILFFALSAFAVGFARHGKAIRHLR
jgi:hypothetical protein